MSKNVRPTHTYDQVSVYDELPILLFYRLPVSSLSTRTPSLFSLCLGNTHSDWKLQILAVMPICLDMVMLILNRFRIINGQISELAAIECNLKSGRGTSNFTRDYAKDVKFNHY